MKNLKTYKGLAALALATSVSLTGCSNEGEATREDNIEIQREYCTNNEHTHLYIRTPDGIVAYKECEGYMLDFKGTNKQILKYNVYTAEGNFIPGSITPIAIEETNGTLGLNEENTYYLFETTDDELDPLEEMIIENNDIKVYTLK